MDVPDPVFVFHTHPLGHMGCWIKMSADWTHITHTLTNTHTLTHVPQGDFICLGLGGDWRLADRRTRES